MGASGSNILCHDGPKMYLSYSVEDNGNYSVTVSKTNTSKFEFQWSLMVNGTVVITKSTSDGNNATWSSSASGNCGSSFTVTASCGAGSCYLANAQGESKDNYTVVSTINLHTHSNPTIASFYSTGVTTTSISLTYSVSSWGCSSASKWYLKGGPYADWTNFSGNDNPTITGLTPGTSYDFYCKVENAHGYTSETGPYSVRTRYATPSISLTNTNSYSSQQAVSASSNSINVSASNSVSNVGDLKWYFSNGSYDSGGSSNTRSYTNLSAGTQYTIKAKAQNPDGDWSNEASLTIRTKYTTDNFTKSITINDIGLENVVFSTSIQKDNKYPNSSATGVVSSATYSISGGISGDGCSNTAMSISNYTISKTTSSYNLTPSNSYTIKVTAKLTHTYDDIILEIVSGTFTTDAKAYFHTSPVNGEFQLPGTYFTSYTVKNPSGNKIKVILRAKSNINSAWTEVSGYTFETQLSDSSLLTKYADLTDAQWDQIYKLMSNLNSISFDVTIYTYSNRYSGYQMSNTRFYSNESKTLTLTGNKKTVYLGKDGVHRARAYIGVGDTVKKAIVWIGDSSKTPRRTI